MFEVDITVPAHLNDESIPEIVEQVCAQMGLDRSSRGTLAKYPGCIHWHYKHGRQRGTLEITWWNKKRRLWIKVAAGRAADWIDEIIPRLKLALEEHARAGESV